MPDGSDDAKSETYRKGMMSLIMAKHGGRWLITVFHNMDLPVVPPGSTKPDVPCQFRSPHLKQRTEPFATRAQSITEPFGIVDASIAQCHSGQKP